MIILVALDAASKRTLSKAMNTNNRRVVPFSFGRKGRDGSS